MLIGDVPGYPLVDLGLARRLERTEACANARFVESRAKVEPEVGATWIEVAGAKAMFDGVASPCTQTFGLGLFDAVGARDFSVLEAFFRDRGAAVAHEISPLGISGLLPHLHQRGYAPIEFTSVLFRPIGRSAHLDRPDSTSVVVRPLAPGEEEIWATVAAEGWSSESADAAAFVRGMGRISARAEGTWCFLAELDDRPVGAGALSIAEGVGLLAGASTVPAARRRGVQRALLEGRLRFAADRGCDLLMLCAAPGSASQRNGERQGFRIAYTRSKWQLAA